MEANNQPSKSQLDLIFDALIENLRKYPNEFSPTLLKSLTDLAQAGKLKSAKQILNVLSSVEATTK